MTVIWEIKNRYNLPVDYCIADTSLLHDNTTIQYKSFQVTPWVDDQELDETLDTSTTFQLMSIVDLALFAQQELYFNTTILMHT